MSFWPWSYPRLEKSWTPIPPFTVLGHPVNGLMDWGGSVNIVLYDHWWRGGWDTTMVIHAGHAPPQLCDEGVYMLVMVFWMSQRISELTQWKIQLKVESGHKESSGEILRCFQCYHIIKRTITIRTDSKGGMQVGNIRTTVTSKSNEKSNTKGECLTAVTCTDRGNRCGGTREM